MPFQRPQVRYMPDLPMEGGVDHESYIADLLEAQTDSEIESLVLEIVDPQLEMTPADRAVLFDVRVIERNYAALSRVAAEISRRGAQPPKGIRSGDMATLRGRIKAEREPMGKVVKQLIAAEDSEKIRLNARAHRITGRIHHHTLAAARAMLRKGMPEDAIVMSLRDQLGIPRTDDAPAEEDEQSRPAQPAAARKG